MAVLQPTQTSYVRNLDELKKSESEYKKLTDLQETEMHNQEYLLKLMKAQGASADELYRKQLEIYDLGIKQADQRATALMEEVYQAKLASIHDPERERLEKKLLAAKQPKTSFQFSIISPLTVEYDQEAINAAQKALDDYLKNSELEKKLNKLMKNTINHSTIDKSIEKTKP